MNSNAFYNKNLRNNWTVRLPKRYWTVHIHRFRLLTASIFLSLLGKRTVPLFDSFLYILKKFKATHADVTQSIVNERPHAIITAVLNLIFVYPSCMFSNNNACLWTFHTRDIKIMHKIRFMITIKSFFSCCTTIKMIYYNKYIFAINKR